MDKKSAGIYKVNFPILGGIYILVTSEQDKQEHIWLTSLSDHMCEEDARILLSEAKISHPYRKHWRNLRM